MDPSLSQESRGSTDYYELDALLEKLAAIAPSWGETFAAFPYENRRGYANLRMLVNRYGRTRVRSAMTSALEQRIVPSGDPIALLTAIVKGSR